MSNTTQIELVSVVAFWRDPVKSMTREELNAADVTEGGLLGIMRTPLWIRPTGPDRIIATNRTAPEQQ